MRPLPAVYHPSVMQTVFVSLDSIVKVSSALLTPTIGAIAVFIAYQQWKTNKRQARLALFDKRMEVFKNTTKLIGVIVQHANVELMELFEFQSETSQHEFLFGPDIAVYLDELWKRGLELNTLVKTREQFARQTELVNWFSQQLKVAEEKFGRYMSFSEP